MAKLMLELRHKTSTQNADLFMPFTRAFLHVCQAMTSDFITQKMMA